MEEQDHGLADVLDWKLLEAAQPASKIRKKYLHHLLLKIQTEQRVQFFRMKFQKNIKLTGYRMIPFILNLPVLPDKVLEHSIPKG